MFSNYSQLGLANNDLLLQKVYIIAIFLNAAITFWSVCMIYEKNGAKCWHQLIPFYGEYVLFKIFWKGKYFIAYLVSLVLFIVSCLLLYISSLNMDLYISEILSYKTETLFFVSILLILISFVSLFSINLLLSYNMCKSYGYDGLFTLGMKFLPVIFFFILGIKSLKGWTFYKMPIGRKLFTVLTTILLLVIGAVYYILLFEPDLI